MSEARIAIGSIAWRQIDVDHMLFVQRAQTLRRGTYYIPKYGDAMVDRARGVLTQRFLEQTDADVLIQIDTDIVGRPEDVVAVCDQALEVGIVCAAYASRSLERTFPTSHFKLNDPIVFGDDPTPREIVWPAGGYLAVRRDVFEQTIAYHHLPRCENGHAPFYPLYTPFVVTGEDGRHQYLSEDWAFGERAREAGFPTYLNPAVRLAHIGAHAFKLEHTFAELPPDAPLEITRTSDHGYVRRFLTSAPVGV